ncbi:MAG: hypothetical protein MJ252_24695 [archaeon]|nr:hypothetical protein [archaeon]
MASSGSLSPKSNSNTKSKKRFIVPDISNNSAFNLDNKEVEVECESFLKKVYKDSEDQLQKEKDYEDTMKGEKNQKYVEKKFKKMDFDLMIPENAEKPSKEYIERKDSSSQRMVDDTIEHECHDVLESVFDDYRKDKIKDDKEYKETYMKEQHKLEKDWIEANLNSILLIQRNWKTHYDRERIKLLKSKAFIIQRAFRSYLIKKYNFPLNFFFNDKYIKMQNETFEENYKENLKVLFPVLFMDKSDPVKFTNELINHNLSSVLPRNPFEAQKIFLFEKMLDFDMMIETDECYEDLWASLYDKVITKNIKKMTPIQLLAVGGQHTLLVNSKGKVFSFGWNNYGQCGVPISSSILPTSQIKDSKLISVTKNNELKAKVINCVTGIKSPDLEEISNASCIACGEDHSLILDNQGKVWAFGLNLNGQLGLGHNNIVEKPTKIDALSKEKIAFVKSEGNINFAINAQGELFMWPWADKEGVHYLPNKVQIRSPKEKFKSIACGNNFVLLLTENGLVYSMGNSNKYGQLGHGDFEKKLYPSLIKFFANSGEKITQISCGFKHAVAKSSSGRAYTWGFGGKGQLGLGNFYNFSLPSQVQFSDTFNKVYQVAAGYRSTFYLCENRKIFTSGCSGSFSMEKSPVLFDVIDKIPEISLEENLSVVRILTTWNKSFSILYATIADYSSLKLQKAKLNSILNILASRWDFDGITPPYVEAYEKYFPVGVMKKKEKAKAEEVLKKADLDWRDRKGNKITAEKNKIYDKTRKFE